MLADDVDRYPSNVTRISRAISSEDDEHHPQIVYYQAGLGTGIGLKDQLIGGGTGLGLEENIREAYSFLASNYRENDPELPLPPDSIFLVGFSRGAYTARSIGGLLGAMGLLKKRAMPHFYEVFSDWIHAGDPNYTPLFFDSYFAHTSDVKSVKPAIELARDRNRIDEYLSQFFRILLSLDLTQEVQVKALGVFETVGSLGVPVNPFLQKLFPFLPSYFRDYKWFDTRLDSHVENAFQALALDERRFPFSPTLWERKGDSKTNLKQVWFPGSHSNVGGSYEDTGIANITLAWMMDNLAGNVAEHSSGFVARDWIKFDEEYIEDLLNSEIQWYERNKKEEYRGWGMGKVYNTVYFPISLTGTRVRHPGRYNAAFYMTGKDETRLLENTEERMHSCVRARIDLGGRPVEPDWNQVFPNGFSIRPWLTLLWHKIFQSPEKTYQPQANKSPLHGWRLDDGHDSHREPNWELVVSPVEDKKIQWVYEGEDPCSTRIMPEDTLGPFELKLLQKDQKFAEQVIVSNKAWRWFKKQPQFNVRAQHTF